MEVVLFNIYTIIVLIKSFIIMDSYVMFLAITDNFHDRKYLSNIIHIV